MAAAGFGRFGRRMATWLAAAVCAVAIAACSPVYRNHGYAPSDKDLAQITVGVDTREPGNGTSQTMALPEAGA